MCLCAFMYSMAISGHNFTDIDYDWTSFCSFTSHIVDLSTFLPYIIPTVTQRLGQAEMVEPCEELRLCLVEMLCSIVEICQNSMETYIDDMVKILQRTFLDPFHEVRKVSSILPSGMCHN